MPNRRNLPHTDDANVQESAAAIASRVCSDGHTLYHIRGLLQACTPMSAVSAENLRTVLGRLATALTEYLTIAIRSAVQADHEYLLELRRFYRTRGASYSLRDLASIWRVPYSEVRDAFADELAAALEKRSVGPDEVAFDWLTAIRIADEFGFVRPVDVEQALASDFDATRPEAWRSVPVLVCPPRFVIRAICADPNVTASSVALEARIEQFILDSVAADGKARAIPEGVLHVRVD